MGPRVIEARSRIGYSLRNLLEVTVLYQDGARYRVTAFCTADPAARGPRGCLGQEFALRCCWRTAAQDRLVCSRADESEGVQGRELSPHFLVCSARGVSNRLMHAHDDAESTVSKVLEDKVEKN